MRKFIYIFLLALSFSLNSIGAEPNAATTFDDNNISQHFGIIKNMDGPNFHLANKLVSGDLWTLFKDKLVKKKSTEITKEILEETLNEAEEALQLFTDKNCLGFSNLSEKTLNLITEGFIINNSIYSPSRGMTLGDAKNLLESVIALKNVCNIKENEPLKLNNFPEAQLNNNLELKGNLKKTEENCFENFCYSFLNKTYNFKLKDDISIGIITSEHFICKKNDSNAVIFVFFNDKPLFEFAYFFQAKESRDFYSFYNDYMTSSRNDKEVLFKNILNALSNHFIEFQKLTKPQAGVGTLSEIILEEILFCLKNSHCNFNLTKDFFRKELSKFNN